MKLCKKSFGFLRKSGILMPVSSLPSEYGIGSFGKHAREFIDFLDATGQSAWQVLPMGPTSYGDSPYQSPASVAGNPYFIDLEALHADGLLTDEELERAKRCDSSVNYGELFSSRYDLLRRAYAKFCADDDYGVFCVENASWLEDYALFMALKVENGYRSWVDWEECYRDVRMARRQSARFSPEMGFWKWVQYTFFSQWKELLDYAHEKGILIIGDMPIYVAHDSMEVWSTPEQFLLEPDYSPSVVAGCPPDAYSKDGQLWGNPIYNWEKMKENGYAWWVERVRRSFDLYDLLRIDHFRGFASYYSIPGKDQTAAGGVWEEGPGKALFDAIRERFPKSKIIAEDLGHITDDVRALLKSTGFPGMKVLQFAFGCKNSEYLPRIYKTDNCIVYTSSHDSDCFKSWYQNADKSTRARFRLECPRKKGQTVTDAAVELAMRSRANLCVITLQDYLELTNEEGRMNVPSVAEGNWAWRVKDGYATEKLIKKVRRLTRAGGRMKE